MPRNPIQKVDVLLMGSAIEITTVLDKSDATTTITITDAYENTRVDEAAMTKLSANTFQYIFQSDENWTGTEYIITISAVIGIYTSKSQYTFSLKEMD